MDVRPLLTELQEAGVRYVLTGSVAAAAYGVPVEPRDLDVAPETEPENLTRLAALLTRIGAKPRHDPNWQFSEEECERWTPDPPTEENLDHLFDTRLGPLDVVPWRSGRYEELAARGLPVEADGLRVLVAHPDDLAAKMTFPKQRERLPHLAAAAARPRPAAPW